MVDLDILEKHGLTPENLKKWFNIDPMSLPSQGPGTPIAVPPDKEVQDRQDRIAALMNRIRSRTQEGRDRNFKDYRTFHALDLAWDTPFRQISPTLMSQFLDSDPNEEAVQKQIESWGLTNMITEEIDKKSGKPTGKKALNLPVFFKVLVPLVAAYVKIRWAKICNDRRLLPTFKYAPIKSTAEIQVRCDAITDRIQLMSDQMGYYEVMKQSVLKMLHYSKCFQFIKEEWYCEYTRKIADEIDVANFDGDANEAPYKVGDEIKCTDKEGFRYHNPHPTRTYYDIAHPPHTLNNDIGCEYTGYWHIVRYRDVNDNPRFWNKDRISLGASNVMTMNPTFFATVYSACTLTIPVLQPPKTPDGGLAAAGVGAGTADSDREKELANQFYGHDHMDQGVLVTEHFEKLIPKDNGMGDYDCPVWFRFVLAGDGCTILYAAPLACPPVVYYGYDEDASRTNNPSLSLEILPFQDQFSNVLTQIIETCKQNLANFALVDSDVLDPDVISTVKNIGQKLFQKLNIFEFSGKKVVRGQQRLVDILHTYNLPKGNVSELINVLKTILDVLERVLVMSSHEVAQAASHEQTREEVKNIASSTSTRLLFTATPVDIARDAWKRQLYWGLMAYGDPYIYTHIPSETPLTKEQLTKFGFTFNEKDVEVSQDNYRRAKVHKDDTAIDIWYLTATRDGDDRVNDAQIAVAMAQFAQQLLMNPLTAQAVGADQFIEMANRIGQLAGLPRDFKIRNMTPQQSPEDARAAAQAQLKAVVDATLQQLLPIVAKQLEPLLQATKENSNDIAKLMQLFLGGFRGMMPAVSPDQAPNPRNDTLTANPVPAPGNGAG